MPTTTRVFISWHGPLSQKLGEALRKWLPTTLQFVRPYFSSDDVAKGVRWNSEVSKELENTNIGLACLTKDTLEAPWILFEAGALSKSVSESRVCPILFGVEPEDIPSNHPLTGFQHTRFNKPDFRRLISEINDCAGEMSLDANLLEDAFETRWPKIEQDVHNILESYSNGVEYTPRTDRDIQREILDLVRLTARTSHRQSVTPEAIVDLVGVIEELQFALAGSEQHVALHIIARLDRPIRHLCLEAGLPDLLQRFSDRSLSQKKK